MRYKRVVSNRKRGPDVLEVVETDPPYPDCGEVCVKVLTAGVLFADILLQSGASPVGPKPPFVPGYDLVGVVDKLGTEVSGLTIGQTVTAMIETGDYTQYAFLPPGKPVRAPEGQTRPRWGA